MARLLIAWAISRGEDSVPFIGARRLDRLTETLGAVNVNLTVDELGAIERAVPPGTAAGDRYDSHGMMMLDTERGQDR